MTVVDFHSATERPRADASRRHGFWDTSTTRWASVSSMADAADAGELLDLAPDAVGPG